MATKARITDPEAKEIFARLITDRTVSTTEDSDKGTESTVTAAVITKASFFSMKIVIIIIVVLIIIGIGVYFFFFRGKSVPAPPALPSPPGAPPVQIIPTPIPAVVVANPLAPPKPSSAPIAPPAAASGK